MHTFTWSEEGKRGTPLVVRFHHNGDFSGEVIIHDDVDRNDPPGLEIPIAAILAFAAEYVRTEKIRRLENASTNEVLLGEETR